MSMAQATCSRYNRALLILLATGCSETTASRLDTIAISPDSGTVVAGDSLRLLATVTDPAGQPVAGASISWSSSDTTKLVVSPNGIARGRAQGTATAIASFSGATGRAVLHVLVVASVKISARDDSIFPGDTITFAAIVVDSGGDTLTGRSLTWTGTPGILSVDSAGLAKGLFHGTGVVHAQSGGIAGTDSVRVMVPIASLDMRPESLSVAPGTAFPLSAILKDSTGQLVEQVSVGWASSDSAVGTVDSAGYFHSAGLGKTTVQATAERRSRLRQYAVVAPGLKTVSAGSGHACGLGADSSAYCWGGTDLEVLGNRSVGNVTGPSLVVGGYRFASVVAGASHNCALTAAGVGYCWGSNIYWALGTPAVAQDTFTPQPISGGLTFRVLSAGADETCGLTTDSLAYCWGELGNTAVPTAVSGGLRWANISVGGGHVCGVTGNGVGYCWGLNDEGRLGDSTTTAHSAPTAVAGGLQFAEIVAGGYHSCGVTTGNDAYCWGYGPDGEIGNDTAATVTTPHLVSGGIKFTSISAGLYYNCALSTSSDVYCWGQAGDQLGPNATGNALVPVAVGIKATWLTTGDNFACAMESGGIYCWGSGDLGNGSTAPSANPLKVLGQP